jgi:RNA polymerase sigma-70 factor (ECF subfamily)
MGTPQTSLSLLEQAAGESDADAWQRVTGLYSPMIRAWLRRLHVAEQDVDDVTQDVLFALVRALPQFQHNHRTGAFRAWLRSVTVNRVREHWRRRGEEGAPQASSAALEQLQDPQSDLAPLLGSGARRLRSRTIA